MILNTQQKASLARHQRRILARQRKAEGKEYMSIIKQDVIKVVTPKKPCNEPPTMLKFEE